MLLSCVLVYLRTAVFFLLRFLSCVIDTVFCQLDSSATSWRDQGLFQHLLQAVVVKSVCEPRLTYACSDVVYVAETAMCTETIPLVGDVAVKYVLCAVSTHKALLHRIPTSGSILHHVLLTVWPH